MVKEYAMVTSVCEKSGFANKKDLKPILCSMCDRDSGQGVSKVFSAESAKVSSWQPKGKSITQYYPQYVTL